MKQTIRHNTFETNSSSYHTLSIRPISKLSYKKQIIKGQDLIISTNIAKTKIGYTESYLAKGISNYEKAQMVLRFLGYDLEDQIDELVDRKEYTDDSGIWDHDKRNMLLKEQFYNTPFIKAFIKAIKKYIGEDQNVVIEFTKNYNPFIDVVSDEGKSICELFNVDKDDLTNVDKMSEVFYNVIFNDEIEMVEQCESNE